MFKTKSFHGLILLLQACHVTTTNTPEQERIARVQTQLTTPNMYLCTASFAFSLFTFTVHKYIFFTSIGIPIQSCVFLRILHLLIDLSGSKYCNCHKRNGFIYSWYPWCFDHTLSLHSQCRTCSLLAFPDQLTMPYKSTDRSFTTR